MIFLKSYLKNKYKLIIQIFFKFFYGLIEIATNNEIKNSLIIENIKINENFYKFFSIKNCRL